MAASSVAVGNNALAVGQRTTALGDNALAFGNNSVAVGEDSAALADNSVALGANSVATEPNTVSVGAPGMERRVTNVDDGRNGTDAVNVRQLRRTESRLNARIDRVNRRVSDLEKKVEKNTADIAELGRRLEKTQARAYAGVASAAAIVSPIQSLKTGDTTVTAGVALYEGESAVGVNVAHALDAKTFAEDGLYVSAGIAVNSENSVLARLAAEVKF
ncbi:MAG: hypothetical protein RMM52_04390 [Verrucomicrobiota bacterium]|nr:hypothetical protein [Verrucomicrobiota bacterium]